MVEQSDRAPLLDWEEIPPPDPNQAAQPQTQPPREEDSTAEKSAPKGTAAGTGWSSSGSSSTTATIDVSATTTTPIITPSATQNVTAVVVKGDGSPGRTELSGHGWDRPQPLGTDRNVPFPGLSVRDQWEEKDQIVAVFVVTFDTRSGEQVDFDLFIPACKILRHALHNRRNNTQCIIE